MGCTIEKIRIDNNNKKEKTKKTYDSIRVREMCMALMAARQSSRAPTLSVMEKWTVVLTGATGVSVHLWRWWVGAAADMVDWLLFRWFVGRLLSGW